MKNIVYAGMDVHKEKTVITIYEPSMNSISKAYETETSTKSITKLFSKFCLSDRFQCCYEAGAIGNWLYRELNEKGYNCVVIAPSSIPRAPLRKVKTDRIDSKNLAVMLAKDMLSFVNICDKEQESIRQICRTHFALAKDLRQNKTRLISRLRQLNFIYPKSNWTKSFWTWYDKIKVDEIDRISLDVYRNIILCLDTQRSELKKEMHEQLITDRYKDDYELLDNVRGLSDYSILSLLTEIPDYSLFKRGGDFSSFIGITGSEHSSAGSQKRGKITKTGNKFIRTILVEAAWSYTKPFRISSKKKLDLEKLGIKEKRRIDRLHVRLKKRYFKMTSVSKKKPGVAIVAIARELGEAVWSLMNRKYGTLED